jgi:hypothetical protein
MTVNLGDLARFEEIASRVTVTSGLWLPTVGTSNKARPGALRLLTWELV